MGDLMAQATMFGPQAAVGGAFLLCLAAGLALPRGPRLAAASRWLAAFASAAAAALSLTTREMGATDLLMRDGLTSSWEPLFFLGAIPLALLMRADDERPAALVLATALGMSVVAAARHLLLLLLGFELMSLPAYLLVYSLKRDRRSLEAAVKYFFAGGVAGAFYLFGLSVFYALTGTMSLTPIGTTSEPLELALALMGAAALFKVGAFPLNFWMPDVYEASAPELSGFFSTSMKAAAVLMLLRLLRLLPWTPGFGLAAALPWVAAVTMASGNLLALRQRSLQRLLAYSSVSHAGYLLMGVWAWTRPGAEAAVPSSLYLYLAAYLFTSTGAFAFLALSGAKDLGELRGYASRRPALAAFFALMLLSLASVPPTSGFLAKFFVFWDALRAGGVWLCAWAALNSVVGLAYYFRVIREMYLEAPEAERPAPPVAGGARALLWACAAPTVALGLVPAAKGWMEALLTR